MHGRGLFPRSNNRVKVYSGRAVAQRRGRPRSLAAVRTVWAGSVAFPKGLVCSIRERTIGESRKQVASRQPARRRSVRVVEPIGSEGESAPSLG